MSFVLVSNWTSTVILNIVLAGLFRLQSVGSGHFVPKGSTILLQLWEILKSGNIFVIIDMKHTTFPEIQSHQGKASVLGLPYILLTLSVGKRPVLWSSLCNALGRGNSRSKHSPEAQLRGILLQGCPTPRILPSIQTSTKTFMFFKFSPIPDGLLEERMQKKRAAFQQEKYLLLLLWDFHFLKRLPLVDNFFHSVRLPPNTWAIFTLIFIYKLAGTGMGIYL